ncbi:hypothetical protein D9M71_566690 [compost metagenome]
MAQAPGQSIEAQAVMGQAVLDAQQQAPLQAFYAAMQVAGIRRQQFGGGRRCWRTHVGDEVADRHIGFMADRTDDWRDAGIHGPGHGFFVETP